jgi:hypothetical protein
MSQLTKLENGNWIYLEDIRAISVVDPADYPSFPDMRPGIILSIPCGSDTYRDERLYTETVETAKALADKYAELINNV